MSKHLDKTLNNTENKSKTGKSDTLPVDKEEKPDSLPVEREEKIIYRSIHEAMIAVCEKVPYVQKTGEIFLKKGGSYKVATEADLIDALRPEMVNAHIYIYPCDIEHFANKSNTAISKYTYRLFHSDSETYIDVVAIGEGFDLGDKEYPKAATIAQKYALRQAFLIETGDDPDKFSSEELLNEKYNQIANEIISVIKNQNNIQELKDYFSMKWNDADFKYLKINYEFLFKRIVKEKDKRKEELLNLINEALREEANKDNPENDGD